MNAPDFWTRHVFVLLSPDATYRGVHLELIERLRKERLVPVAAKVVHSYPELIDELYADLIAGQWQTWRYRLVDASLTLGPAVALICRYDGEGDAHAEAAARKGYQHPEEARPGTIRRDLGAVNSIVGLMHSSDGPAESEREAKIFGLTAADAVEPQEAAPRIDYLCRLIAPPAPEHRDFDRTLASVRTRVLAAFWDVLPEPTRDRARRRFSHPDALGAIGAGADLAELLDGTAPAPLLPVLRCEFEPEWRERIRIGQVEDALQSVGVVLDRWERLVLESSLHFRPRRASRQPAG
jgi:nucleoside diphosphate kinase